MKRMRIPSSAPPSRASLRAIHLLPLVAIPLLLLAACGDGDEGITDPTVARGIPADLSESIAVVVDGNNHFAWDLYKALADSTEGNLFFSPFSISTALAMTYAGAAGVTEEELAEVLHFPDEQEQLHPSYGALVASIDRGSGLGGYALTTANRLWGRIGYPFLEPFLKTCTDHYAAGFESLDFVADPEGCRQTINAWVEEKTEDRIIDLIQPGLISPVTVLVLTNAIYFKGTWETLFDPDETRDRPFYLEGGGQAMTPFMYRTATHKIGQGEGVQILELPYKGKDLSFFVLLPDAYGGIGDLEANLTEENWDLWRSSVAEVEDVEVVLPKFEFTLDYRLDPMLVDLGMPSAFRADADFSRMTEGGGGLFISAVVHKAFVRIDEEGSEAAAATAVIVDEFGGAPTFIADHPLLFLIHDNLTGSILFLGRVMDPSA